MAPAQTKAKKTKGRQIPFWSHNEKLIDEAVALTDLSRSGWIDKVTEAAAKKATAVAKRRKK